jgi:hypothetical protein
MSRSSVNERLLLLLLAALALLFLATFIFHSIFGGTR